MLNMVGSYKKSSNAFMRTIELLNYYALMLSFDTKTNSIHLELHELMRISEIIMQQIIQ